MDSVHLLEARTVIEWINRKRQIMDDQAKLLNWLRKNEPSVDEKLDDVDDG